MEIPDALLKDVVTKGRIYFNSLRKLCKKCNGDGMITVNDDTCVKCDCTIKYYNNKKYLHANLPLDYLDISLSDIKKVYEPKCYDAYISVLKKIEILISKGFSFLFYRKNEKAWGITTAGTILIKKLVDNDRDLFSVDSLSLFDNFFSFSDNSEINSNRTQVLSFYSSIPILMIDGFGTEGYRKEQKSGFVFQKFASFLNLRKLNNRITIICSDLTMKQIEDNYDNAMTSFLKNEMVQFPISCNFDRNKGSASQKIEKLLPEMKGLFTGDIKSESKVNKLL